MARSLRRLVAGAVVAGSLVTLAPPAQASMYCYEFRFRDGYYRICL